jgi:hypothetical protein
MIHPEEITYITSYIEKGIKYKVYYINREKKEHDVIESDIKDEQGRSIQRIIYEYRKKG